MVTLTDVEPAKLGIKGINAKWYVRIIAKEDVHPLVSVPDAGMGTQERTVKLCCAWITVKDARSHILATGANLGLLYLVANL